MLLNSDTIEKWGIFEIELKAKTEFDNPFTQGELAAKFVIGGKSVNVFGFYDGDNIWRIRFMPQEEGEYSFLISSNMPEFTGQTGSFTCMPPSEGNHGPVRVYKKYHFAYDDGEPFFVLGTSCYAWTTRSDEMRKQTLESLSQYAFTKLRFGFFPKRLQGLPNIDITYDPPILPYEGERGHLDLQRFNPVYFRRFEEDVRALLNMGIEADIMLFHFYDFGFWGINPGLTAEEDLLYVRYMAARLSAFRNIWWCISNEYDLLLTPLSEREHIIEAVSNQKDWDAIGKQLKAADPYNHLISIHNFTVGRVAGYDWLSHTSFQNGNTYSLVLESKRRYGKPAIADEYGYEGNIFGNAWGDRTPEEETLRHMQAIMAGGYASHGESYIVGGNKRDIFWAYGGKMVGKSAAKLSYFRHIIESCPFTDMDPEIPMMHESGGLCLAKGSDVFLMFFRYPDKRGGFNFFTTDMRKNYEMTLYDLWNCVELEKRIVSKGFVEVYMPDWAVIKLEAI
ncbi:MAG: DUF5060 domain-containing protein [Clostridiales bacterium]|jgi:hypothetical protein|nr:DUF5060 domain-containing protein [Clostridiales bacterium]